MSKRIRRTAEESRLNILDAAEGLLRDNGSSDFRLTEVAKRAGTTHSNVLSHFGSVLSLQRATASRIAASLVKEIGSELQSDNSGREPVAQAIRLLFERLCDPLNRDVFAWLFMSDREGNLPGLAEGLAVLRTVIAARVNARGGAISADNPELVSLLHIVISAAIGSGLGGRYLADANGAVPSNEELADQLAALVYKQLSDPG